jgi:hypothetical protein
MPSFVKPIAAPAKFKIGDRVRILPEGQAVYAGVEGVIRDVHPNDRGIAVLNRYDVLFNWGEEKTFYEVQLEQMADRLH